MNQCASKLRFEIIIYAKLSEKKWLEKVNRKQFKYQPVAVAIEIQQSVIFNKKAETGIGQHNAMILDTTFV